MKKRSMVSVLAVIALAPCLAHAQGADIWSGWTTVTHLYPQSTGFYFNTAYVNTSLSTCDSGTRWLILSTYPEYEVMTASLIAAFMAGKEVNINITVAAPACSGQVNRFLVR